MSHGGTDGGTASEHDDLLNTVIADKYYITDKVGQGGMGVVYRATHQLLNRTVAIKMLHADLAMDETNNKRFSQEAEAVSLLNHPNIITLFEFGVLPAPSYQPYLVMEYLDGIPLFHNVKIFGPLDHQRAVRIFTQIADGLQHAHLKGIVHRDLKPSNILLIERNEDRDFVKIVDFGLAKLMSWSGKESQHLTKTGEVFGSPIYMSPEQCMGRKLYPTSDIYSLGVTLYESLVGVPPFRGLNSVQTATAHMNADVPRFVEKNPTISVSEELECVVLKMLQKEPDDRYQSMDEFKEALLSAAFQQDNIGVPASLTVSVQGTPSMYASYASGKGQALKDNGGLASNKAGAPGKGQSAFKSLRGLDGPSTKKPNLVLYGGIAAAVLAVGGGIAAYYLAFGPGAANQTKETITGTIWHYDDHSLTIHNDNGIYVLGGSLLSENAAKEQLPEREVASQLGRQTEVTFLSTSRSERQGEFKSLNIKTDDTPESAALRIVENFLSDMINQDYKLASELSPFSATQIEKRCKESELKSARETSDYSTSGALTVKAYDTSIEAKSGETVTLQVLKSPFIKNSEDGGSWKFAVATHKVITRDTKTNKDIVAFDGKIISWDNAP